MDNSENESLEYSNENLLNSSRLQVYDPSNDYGFDESIQSDSSSDTDQSLAESIVDHRFNEIMYKYDIQKIYAEHLHLLEDYEIIIVCDDSGSMNTDISGTSLTRWDQLRFIVEIIIDIGIVFDSSGVDIYFLNRKSYFNVQDTQSVKKIFSKKPRGYTPIVPILEKIFELPSTKRGNDKKTLVFIATDGQPTDEKGADTIHELEYLMNEKRNIDTTHVMFLICTDDHCQVEYLSKWDEQMTNVDITKDYHSERKQILECRGENFLFSLGDYICKALLGAIHPFFDGLNESKPLVHITKH